MMQADRLRHCTRAMYNAGCRCGYCRFAENEAKMNWKARPRVIPDEVHGTLSGSTNYGCRCDACKRARREYTRDYRRRHKEAS